MDHVFLDIHVRHRLRIAESRLLPHVDAEVSAGCGMFVCVWLSSCAVCKPAGMPSGMCGGPGRPIGVPTYGMPYCGAVTPAT